MNPRMQRAKQIMEIPNHASLNGQTPAEAAKITVDGKNKWKTIIQNASLSKDSV